MTENAVYWAVSKGKETIENQRLILYNIKKIDCPFIGGEKTGIEYDDISEMNADWYIGYTYFRQYGALVHISKKYPDDLLFFGVTTGDTNMVPELLEEVVKAEEEALEKVRQALGKQLNSNNK